MMAISCLSLVFSQDEEVSQEPAYPKCTSFYEIGPVRSLANGQKVRIISIQIDEDDPPGIGSVSCDYWSAHVRDEDPGALENEVLSVWESVKDDIMTKHVGEGFITARDQLGGCDLIKGKGFWLQRNPAGEWRRRGFQTKQDVGP